MIIEIVIAIPMYPVTSPATASLLFWLGSVSPFILKSAICPHITAGIPDKTPNIIQLRHPVITLAIANGLTESGLLRVKIVSKVSMRISKKRIDRDAMTACLPAVAQKAKGGRPCMPPIHYDPSTPRPDQLTGFPSAANYWY